MCPSHNLEPAASKSRRASIHLCNMARHAQKYRSDLGLHLIIFEQLNTPLQKTVETPAKRVVEISNIFISSVRSHAPHTRRCCDTNARRLLRLDLLLPVHGYLANVLEERHCHEARLEIRPIYLFAVVALRLQKHPKDMLCSQHAPIPSTHARIRSTPCRCQHPFTQQTNRSRTDDEGAAEHDATNHDNLQAELDLPVTAIALHVSRQAALISSHVALLCSVQASVVCISPRRMAHQERGPLDLALGGDRTTPKWMHLHAHTQIVNQEWDANLVIAR